MWSGLDVVRDVVLVRFKPGVICRLSLILVLALLGGFFSGLSNFFPPKKHASLNSKSTWKEDPCANPADVASSLNLVVSFLRFTPTKRRRVAFSGQ